MRGGASRMTGAGGPRLARIAYILLCHKDPDRVIAQVRSLTGAGDAVAIHVDARAARGTWQALRDALAEDPAVVFASRRIRCGWGEWSLVRATLETLRTALRAFDDASHFYLISGDCMPVKPATFVHARLDERDADRIESVDFLTSDWIRTGWREERLIYRHWFNERTQRGRFYAMYEVQKRLGLRRAIPEDIRVMIGSQWWCLRRGTVDAVLEFIECRPDVLRFFRTTWIPDETFFQTLVRHLVPSAEIDSRPPTFLLFSDYGMPVTFHDDQYDLLVSQDALFARKIGREAQALHRRLGALYGADGVEIRVSDEGRSLYAFLTGKGRVGRRFAPRFWEREATVGPERTLRIVVCKKWALGRSLIREIGAATGMVCVGYLFNDARCALPGLGGLETTMDKRHRHRRALLRMLYEHHRTDDLVICVDPESLDLIEDFARDRAETRLLEIDCDFDDDWLIGHARRSGLAGAHTPRATIERLLPAMRNTIAHESDRLRAAGYGHHLRVEARGPDEAFAAALAGFLSIDHETALRIAEATDRTPQEERDAP